MNRRKRTEILTSCNLETLKKLSKEITNSHDINILEEPNSGLVMIKMRESAMKHLFYLGEVFVTECKVMIGDKIGLGILTGAHLKKAYHMAVIDAAYNSQLEEVEIIDKMLADIGESLRVEKTKAVANLLKTKVDFVTLDEEVKS